MVCPAPHPARTRPRPVAFAFVSGAGAVGTALWHPCSALWQRAVCRTTVELGHSVPGPEPTALVDGRAVVWDISKKHLAQVCAFKTYLVGATFS